MRAQYTPPLSIMHVPVPVYTVPTDFFASTHCIKRRVEVGPTQAKIEKNEKKERSVRENKWDTDFMQEITTQ